MPSCSSAACSFLVNFTIIILCELRSTVKAIADLAAYRSPDRSSTVEVKELAGAMGGIFQAKGIAREALAAFFLFCEAAKQETATVELTQQVIVEMERARR